ncbi:MAG TPA: DNA-processing protein DprA [Steroidobacteraceae bacterium]
MDPLLVRAVLARTPSLEAGHVQALLAAADGDAGRLLESRIVLQIGLPPPAQGYLMFPDEAATQADLAWILASGTQLLLSTDAAYPPQLLCQPHAPAVLFVLGDVHLLQCRQLAMVGARSPTPAGCRAAHEFAAAFARAGLIVTSGLALGIDAASHAGALRAGGATLAVCATGLDRVYPTQHIGLAARIRANGALVSQFPPRTPPRRQNFPRRNRLLSALTLGTLVVEAARLSGSLVTAACARGQQKPVFAIPGSIYNAVSAGCHKLIRAGATLVENPAQVLAVLQIPVEEEQLVQQASAPAAAPALDKKYEMLLDAVGLELVTPDVLAERTGMPVESVASMLLILELEGRISAHLGGRFGRIP